MSDLERTTISVKTFIATMWAVIGALIVAVWIAAASYWHIVNTMDQHTTQMTTMQGQLTQALVELKTVEQDDVDLKKRMADYRPYKWSTPMMQLHDQETRELNPGLNLRFPDAQTEHDKLLPYTP